MQIKPWTYHFLGTTTFILGSKKNAGKTTFMNLALDQIRKFEAPAFATIGVDGEGNDLIDGKAKPYITTCPGDHLLTTRPLLDKSNGLFELLKVFPYKTVLGQLVVAKTIRGGSVELIGPENNAQLSEIIDFIKSELKCRTIVIDGAANRLTPVSAIDGAGFFYVQYIDQKNIKMAQDNLKLLSLAASYPESKTTDTDYKMHGALTKQKLASIPDGCKSISINNLTSIFLPYNQLKELSKKVQIRVENNYKLKAVVVVSKDLDEQDVKTIYGQGNTKIELINNPYVH